MKSIFHVKANTAEDLRKELLAWLEEQAGRYYVASRHAKTQRDTAIELARHHLIQSAHTFWSELHIDPKETENA